MAFSDTIIQGTVQYYVVTVTDKLGLLTDLSTTSPRFSVYNSAHTLIVNNANGVGVGMQIRCLIDTTQGHPTANPWPLDDYSIYTLFNALPEVPKLGAFGFTILAGN